MCITVIFFAGHCLRLAHECWVQREASIARERIATLQASLEASTLRHEEHVESCSTAQATIDRALSELGTALALYKRLGMRFDRTTLGKEDVLQVVFTCIDPAAPSREFSFAVHVSERDTYNGKPRRAL